MLKVNENFVKLPASYLFVDINNKVNAFMKEHPEQEIIRLGIGDVTRPLPKAVVEAMCAAAKEMGEAETFRGYGPEAGYAFLREAIAKNDFQARGIDISADEIFVSDGAKSDTGSIGDIFGVDRGKRLLAGDPAAAGGHDLSVFPKQSLRSGYYKGSFEKMGGLCVGESIHPSL